MDEDFRETPSLIAILLSHCSLSSKPAIKFPLKRAKTVIRSEHAIAGNFSSDRFFYFLIVNWEMNKVKLYWNSKVFKWKWTICREVLNGKISAASTYFLFKDFCLFMTRLRYCLLIASYNAVYRCYVINTIIGVYNTIISLWKLW